MTKNKSSKNSMPLYLLLRTIICLLSYIPISLSRMAGNIIGFTIASLPVGRQSIVLDNMKKSILSKTMTEEELKKLSKKVYMHFGRMLFEIPHILRIDKKEVSKYFTVEGGENLTEALKKGKGVLALTAHMGNWEMMAMALEMNFGNVSAVARPFGNKAVNRLMQKIRTSSGMEVIPKQNGMRKILSALKKNRIVGILLDQNVSWQEGEFVPFMGRTACANKGLALMAMKTGSPVLPIFALQQPDGKYLIYIGEEVKVVDTGDKTADIATNTHAFTKKIEEQVIKYPEQWFWFHRRWKSKNYCKLPEKR